MNRLTTASLCALVLLLSSCGPVGPVGGTGGGSGGGGSATETISSVPASVSMIATVCSQDCTVSRTVVITSSTPWTSSTPGFGSLSGVVVAPDTGPAGSTTVTIGYTSNCCPSAQNGFIRFRSSMIGTYVEVPVVVTVN